MNNTNYRLNVLLNNIRDVWFVSVNTSDFNLLESPPPITNPIYAGFRDCSTTLEILEVIIENWKDVIENSSYHDVPILLNPLGYYSYKEIRNVFNVQTLEEINLEQEIINSNLKSEEKEYLKLKYFI